MAKDAFITLQRRGTFSLNKMAFAMLGKPEAVEFLFDETEQIVGLRKVDPHVPHAYPVRKQPASESYILAGQAFCQHNRIDVGTSRRFSPEMYGDVLGFKVSDGVEIIGRPQRGKSDAPEQEPLNLSLAGRR